jgi:hypothetical protein
MGAAENRTADIAKHATANNLDVRPIRTGLT